MRRGFDPPRRSLLFLAMFAGALVQDARAATEVVPEVSISAEANDNPRLRVDADPAAAPQSAERLLLEANVSLRRFTERTELTFEPAIRSDAYAGSENDELESTDLFLNGSGRWRWERARLGFSAGLAREKILGTEFLDPPGGIDDGVDVDGVLLGLNETRTRATLRPYTEIDFGERSAVRLDLAAMDVRYDDPTGPSVRTDFTDWEAGAAYVRELSPRTDFSTRVFGGRYEALATHNTTDRAGIEFGVEREISALWSVAGTIGVEEIDYAFIDEGGTYLAGRDNDVVLGLDLRKRSELARLTIGVSRRARPDSFGSVVTRNELAVALERDMTQRLQLGLSVRAIDSNALGTIPLDREYGRVETSLMWSMTELWSLRVGYEFAYWNNLTADTRARSNSFALGFSHRGRSRTRAP